MTSFRPDLLLFPVALRRARRERSLSQKALALILDLDQAQLCAIEKGRRPPPDNSVIKNWATRLEMNSAQANGLSWAADHDRCIRFIHSAVAAPIDTELVSMLLQTAQQLDTHQQSGLKAYLASVQSAAKQMATLSALPRPDTSNPIHEGVQS